MTAFGFNDAGGGTIVPRFAAKELARRGWDVTRLPRRRRARPVRRALRAARVGGGRRPARRRPQPAARAAGTSATRPRARRRADHRRVRGVWIASQPDVVHFHNLHNLGAALLDVAAARGVPLVLHRPTTTGSSARARTCSRGDGALCAGPGDARRDCATCVGAPDAGRAIRTAWRGIRERVPRGVTACLAVVRRRAPHADRPGLPGRAARRRPPGGARRGRGAGSASAATARPAAPASALTVGFFGSAYAHKGAQLLVQAAQLVDATLRVRDPRRGAASASPSACAALDPRGVVELHGAFRPRELPGLLAGVDVAALPSHVVGLRAAGGRRVPRRRASRCWRRGWAASPRPIRDERRRPGLRRRRRRRARARRSSGWRPSRACWSACRPASRRRAAFAAYVDELEAYYAGERPVARGRREPPRPPSRWVGEHDAPTSLARINREVAARLRRRRRCACARATDRADDARAAAARRRRRGAPPVAAGLPPAAPRATSR